MMDVDVTGWAPADIWPGPFEFIWGFLGILATVAFWTLLIVLLVKLLKSGPSFSHHSSSALQVLEERYARGEITREEYFERRAVLSGQPPAAHSDRT